MTRNPLWFLFAFLSFIFGGCVQETTCPTLGKYDWNFQDVEQFDQARFISNGTLILSDGTAAELTRYSQEFSNQTEPRLGGHIYCIRLTPIGHADVVLAEAVGIYCGGFQIQPSVTTAGLSESIRYVGNPLSRISRLKTFIQNHDASFTLGGYGTYGTMSVNTVPLESFVTCAMQYDMLTDPTSCGIQ